MATQHSRSLRLGPTRRRVLATLQRAPGPASLHDLAQQLHLHPNTLRFHLAALIRDGLATQRPDRRNAPGRPRTLYLASAASPALDESHYQELAGLLVERLGRIEGGGQVIHDLGFDWGRRFGAEAPSDDPLVGLTATMNQLGFVSSLRDDRTAVEVRRCPYRELAQDEKPPICQIHLGMMRGYLDQQGADETVTGLEPWVTPELCIAHLSRPTPSTQ